MGGGVFESEAPHFFKIVLSDSIQNGGLGIPKKFVRKHGSSLSDSVFLKLANGDAWQVELLRTNDGVWLRRNWPDFAERYSIEQGHFLVFRYEGDSVFRVVIFDKTATEIDYPVVSENGGGTEHLLTPKVEAEDEGDVVLVEEGFKDLPSSPALSPLSKKSKKKKKTSSQAEEDDEHANEEAINGVGDRSVFSSICRDRSQVNTRGRPKEEELAAKGGGRISCANNSCVESGFWRRVQPLTGRNKGREVLKRAASFRSPNPFFLVLMKPSFLQPRFTLNAPSRFFTTHVPNGNRNRDVDLYDSNGGMWPGHYCFGMYDGKAQVRITRGWSAFAQDKTLGIDDVCVFELVRTDKVSFRIVIFRADIGAHRRPCGKCATAEDEVAMRTLLGNRITGSDGDGGRKRKQEESMSMQKQTPKEEKPVEGNPPKKTKATTQEEPNLISDAEKDEPAIRPVTSTLDELKVQETEIDNVAIKVKGLPKAFRHGLFRAKQMIQSLSRFHPINLQLDPTQTSKSPRPLSRIWEWRKTETF